MTPPSIVLVESQQPDETAIGTGFVIHHDTDSTYLLTCAHVVRDVGGSNQVRAGGVPAQVVAIGEDNGLDLAVLRIKRSHDQPPFHLQAKGTLGLAVRIEGFYKYVSYRALEQIGGRLAKAFKLSDSRQQHFVLAWHVIIDDNDKLLSGYSGSPVYEAAGGAVIGVAITRDGDQQGRVLSIAALPLIWKEMPPELLVAAPVPQPVSEPPVQPLSAPSAGDNYQSGQEAAGIGEILESHETISAPEAKPKAIEPLLHPHQNVAGVTIYLAAHPKATPQATAGELLIDWTDFFRSGDPQPGVWEQHLLPDLERHLRTLRGPARRTIHLRGLARNSVGLAFGYVFRDTANFHLSYTDRDGVVWQTDTAGGSAPWTRSDAPGKPKATDLVIELAMTQVRERTSQPVDHWLNQSRCACRKRITLDLAREPRRFDPAEGITMARELRSIIAQERVTGGTTHLFGSMSLGLALLIGWHLNACGKIQCYELDSEERYQPTCLLRP